MATPSAADVIALTGTKLPEALVEVLITQAGLLAADCLEGASDDLETAVLFWLSAHLVSSASGNGSLTSRKLGDASRSFSVAQLGNGLQGTTYGQQALMLLPCLGTLGGGVATIEVV